jgi:hypothetical protein
VAGFNPFRNCYWNLWKYIKGFGLYLNWTDLFLDVVIDRFVNLRVWFCSLGLNFEMGRNYRGRFCLRFHRHASEFLTGRFRNFRLFIFSCYQRNLRFLRKNSRFAMEGFIGYFGLANC